MELRAERPAPRALALLLGVLAALAALAPPPAQAAGPIRPADPDRPPLGYRLSANQAIAAAEASPRVRAELRSRPGLAPAGYTRGDGRWQVSWFRDRTEVVQARVNDADGAVLEVWTGIQVSWEMARGYPGAFGRSVNSLWIWIPLCLAFAAPFVDPRRPFRLLHLDLFMLLGFSVSHFFFNRGEIAASVPLVYPVLAYLLARMLWAGFRPRAGGDAGLPTSARSPLIPLVPLGALALMLVFLIGFRVALNVVDSNTIDVGYAGVIGADHITRGQPLYEGVFPSENRTGDTYGPTAYLTYVPFELALPWSGRWDDLPAAHAAAVAWDLLTILGLFLVGRRMRAGPSGTALGLALAYAWVAYPYTLFTMQSNSNDSLVAATSIFALLAAGSAPARGALAAVGGMAKFAPLALAPLLAAGTGERRVRSISVFTVVFVAVCVGCVVPFIPDGGLTELFHRTIGSQLSRKSPFSIWGQVPSLRWGQTAVAVAAVGLGVLVAFVPRRRTLAQVAALGAAVLLLVEAATTHWFYLYVVWFAPFALVALMAEHATGDDEKERSPVEADRTAREPALSA